MKLAAIFGSPRRGGNSETLAEAFLQEVEGLGAETVRFRLNELDYRGCQGCNACKKKTLECVQRDDLTQVLEAVRSSDALLIATPVYFLDSTSQTKAFIDRCYSFYEPDFSSRLDPGKKMVFVVTQGAGEESFVDFLQRYNMIFNGLGFQPMHLIRACGLGDEKSAVSGRMDLLEEARETARKFVAGEPSGANIPPYPSPDV